MKPTVKERFWSKVNKDGPVPEYRPELGPCWLWTAGLGSKGYGCFFMDGRSVNAHRVSFEWVNGPIPQGLQPDHLCRVHPCVRPSHLEAVTPRENLMRGETLAAANVLKTHCPLGHPYSEQNTKIDFKRGICYCRTCCNEATKSWKRRVGYKSHQPKGTYAVS